MSDFYTFVDQRFGKILIRGYDDGKQYIKKYNYEPDLFVPADLVSAKSSEHKSSFSKIKIKNNTVSPIVFFL